MAYRPPLSERTPLMQTADPMEQRPLAPQSPTPSPPRVWPSILAALIAAMGAFSFGFTLGFSSPATYQMRVDNSSTTPVQTTGDNLHFKDATLSWFGSLVNVGAMVGGLWAGWLCDFVGRKLGLMLSAVPFTAGWLLISYAKGVAMLFAGRILTGLGVGMVSLMVPVYIAEVVLPSLRGRLGALNQLAITIGILVAFALGVPLDYRWLAIVGVGIAACLVVGMLFLPETPRWYLTREKRHEAKASLRWLRGSNANINEECYEIESALDAQESMSCAEFARPALAKPLAISLIMMVLQQWSGVNAVIFYSTNILKDAGVSNAEVGSIAVGGVQVVFTFISTLLMDRLGRRPLLIIAASGMVIASVGMGAFYEVVTTSNKSHLSLLSLISVLVYIAAFSIGMGSIPWLIMSEIFPNRARSTAAGIATGTNWLNSFVVTLTFHAMTVGIGRTAVFFGYGAICLFMIAFVAIIVPETKGQSLEQIEALFDRPSING